MSHYAQLVRECLQCLTLSWRGKENLKLSEQDLDARIEILTQIALERFSKEPPSEIEDKIKGFFKRTAFQFRMVCETRFPFSKIASEDAHLGLSILLSSFSRSMLLCVLEGHPDLMEEDELNRRFGEALKHLDDDEVINACKELKYEYNNYRSAYYLLWLFKNVSGCDYAMPSKESLGEVSPQTFLSQYIEKGGRPANPDHFMRLWLCGSNRDWLSTGSIFRDFAHRQLKETSMEMGPIKYELIETLMIQGSSLENSALAEHLAQSQDPTTAKIGALFSQAMQAASLNEALPYYKELKKCSSLFGNDFIRKVFKHLIVDFHQERMKGLENPEFTHYLPFSPQNKVFIHGSLMIGVCEVAECLLSLCAFDMDSHELVWAISLNAYFTLQMVESSLVVWNEWERELWIIEAKSGRYHVKKVSQQIQQVYMTPKVIYLFQKQRFNSNTPITIARFEGDILRMSCGLDVTSSHFVPLSTHLGGYDRNSWKICNPTGKHLSMKCKDVKAYGDKLFTINRSPNQNQRGLLSRRTLKLDEEVLGPVEKSIDLPEGNFKIEGLCDNGQLILLSDQAVLFVDQEKESIEVISCEGVNKCFVIDTLRAEVWWWDQSTSHLWKVNSKEALFMGSLKSRSDVSLVHVDSAGKLYYMYRY